MPRYTKQKLIQGQLQQNGLRRVQVEDPEVYQVRVGELLRERDDKGNPIGPPIRPDRIDFPTFLVEYNRTQGRETPRLHLEMAEWLYKTGPFGGADQPRRILQAYRHRRKSYITSVYVCWLLFRDPNFEIIVASAAKDLATRNSTFIRQIIQRFFYCHHLIPEDTDNWRRVNFTIERTRLSLNPSVTCLGIDSAITGNHADMIIGDDVEGSRYASREEWNQKIRERVAEFAPIAPRHLFIGTPHRVDRLYVRLKNRSQGFVEQKWPVWRNEATRETQNTDIPIAGQIQDADWVEQQRASMTEGMFESQFLLIPSRIHKTTFNRQLLKEFEGTIRVYQPKRKFLEGFNRTRHMIEDGKRMEVEIVEFARYYDPATAATLQLDNAVLAIVGRTERNQVYVFEAFELPPIDANRSYFRQCTAIVNKLSEYHLERVTVETNFNEQLANDIRVRAREMGRRVNTIPRKRNRTQEKKAFIAQHLDPVIKTERLYCHKKNVIEQSRFLEQLLDFPHCKKFDAIDAVAGAVAELRLNRFASARGFDPLRLNQRGQGVVANRPRFQPGGKFKR